MDLVAAAGKGLTVVAMIYVGLAAFRAIKEGDIWKAVGTIFAAALVCAFLFSPDFRDSLTTTTKNLFENTFKTEQPQQEKK